MAPVVRSQTLRSMSFDLCRIWHDGATSPRHRSVHDDPAGRLVRDGRIDGDPGKAGRAAGATMAIVGGVVGGGAGLSAHPALARVSITLQSYDAESGFTLPHPIDATSSPNGPVVAHVAARLSLSAAFEREDRQNDASSRSMVCSVADLEPFRRG